MGASLTACGPTPTEVGRNVIAVGPVAYVVVLLVLAGVAALSRKVDATARVPWRFHRIALLALMLPAVPAALTTDLQWYGLALVTVGSLQVGLALVAWRIWRVFDPVSAWKWAPLLSIVTLLPAIPLALGALDKGDPAIDFFLIPWVYGGYLGPPAVVIAFIEAAVRRARA